MSCIHGYWAGTEEYRGASRGRSLEGELKPSRCGWSGDLQFGRDCFSTLPLNVVLPWQLVQGCTASTSHCCRRTRCF